MRVRLHIKSKPNNYTESCMINEADGWRGRNVWYLGRSVRYALKEVSLGYSFFLRRRQENVDAEAASMFIAYNFKRLLSMFSTEELVMRFE